MSRGDQRISNADCTHVVDQLSKRIDVQLSFCEDANNRVKVEAKIENADDLNLRFIALKPTPSTYRFSLLWDNSRIMGIDWKLKQVFDDGQVMYESYHYNVWDEVQQEASKHLYDADLDFKLKHLSEDQIVRYILKRWNIDYSYLEQIEIALEV